MSSQLGSEKRRAALHCEKEVDDKKDNPKKRDGQSGSLKAGSQGSRCPLFNLRPFGLRLCLLPGFPLGLILGSGATSVPRLNLPRGLGMPAPYRPASLIKPSAALARSFAGILPRAQVWPLFTGSPGRADASPSAPSGARTQGAPSVT